MIMRPGILRYISPGLMLGLFMATGCSNHNILPDTGPDIQEVYNRHIGGQQGDPARPPTDEEKEALKQKTSAEAGSPFYYRSVSDGAADLVDYTRHSGNEIEQMFPLLPNPQIVIYVPPHFTAKGRPIPGYTTVTRMYDRDEYAMPGEWIPDHPDAITAGAVAGGQ